MLILRTLQCTLEILILTMTKWKKKRKRTKTSSRTLPAATTTMTKRFRWPPPARPRLKKKTRPDRFSAFTTIATHHRPWRPKASCRSDPNLRHTSLANSNVFLTVKPKIIQPVKVLWGASRLWCRQTQSELKIYKLILLKKPAALIWSSFRHPIQQNVITSHRLQILVSLRKTQQQQWQQL